MQEILSRLEASRKELLDLGLRNPLLNYRPLASRGVHIVQEQSAAVYNLLVNQGKTLSFASRPEKTASKAQEESSEMIAVAAASPVSDTRLQTEDTETVLQNRLLNTYYAARTSIEEQGVNILYLSLGMLHWYESDNSEEARKAPVLLIPVLLERSSARERFGLKYTLEEVGENLSLQAKMKAEYGIAIPDLPEEDDFSITAYFQLVREAVRHQQRWKLEENAIELGFFSFGKFMIYNDLDNSKWPADSKPVAHPIIQSLFTTGFNEPSPTASEEAFIDTETAAHEMFQVVDADSSQILAMLAIQEGRNLVIQGPPGTGKSQTITNIIANAIGQGKKVLFVAEKLAALEVVKRRLDTIHLGDACLELHSHKANKRELHQELKRVLDLGKPALQHLEQQVALLQQHKEELNSYSQAVNTPIQNSGLSAHQLAGRLLQLSQAVGDTALPKFNLPAIEQWNAQSMLRAETLAERIQVQLSEIGVPKDLLFWGSELRVLLPYEQEQIAQLLKAAAEAIEALQGESARIANTMGLTVPRSREECLHQATVVQLAAAQPDLKEVSIKSTVWLQQEKGIQEVLQAGERVATLHQEYDEKLLPEAWEQSVLEVRQELVEHGDKWYRFIIGTYNKANKKLKSFCKAPLPKTNNEKLLYVDAILEGSRLQKKLNELEAFAKEAYGRKWQGIKSDWSVLTAATTYLLNVHQQIEAGKVPAALLAYLERHQNPQLDSQYHSKLLQKLNDHGKYLQAVSDALAINDSIRFPGSTLLHQPLAKQLEWINKWAQRLPEIHQAVSWNNLTDMAADENLQCLTSTAAGWNDAANFLKTALQKTWYEYLLQKAITELVPLRKFERSTHEQVVQQFKRLDSLNLQYNRARAALQHWEAMPETEGGGQMTRLRTEFNKKARHLPIRKLMQEAGLAIQAIKPVLMMSPLSIANFLPPGALEFDLVIFDEASQVRPVDALGAILRGKQLVVVGDSKQLPPTSFFDSLTREIEDEENVTADLQSILGMCDAQGAPQRMLRWHYRSRHQSLINLSNHHFYDNRLVVFPSPGSKENRGLFFHHLKDTAYDRGKSRTNAKEAEIVADAVMEHAQKHPGLTLGVVAFSTAQRQAIQDALEWRRKASPETEAFFKNHTAEPFFVKNLENVQGDERDVIFISIGYGRTEEGYISMSFGPLNNEGGERRLNVLITRAKLRCEVFTNITSADLDTERTQSQGIKALKSFLHFAQYGLLDVPAPTGMAAESPFEEAVAEQLRKLGYQVHQQVGSKGFYLDIAIVDPEHPGRYILGIECDGASYHSARSARDRDRLRQQVLEAMGWTIHRIWSTDWFRNPERELKRVVEAINKAWKVSLEEDPAEEEKVVETSLLREESETSTGKLEPYQLARLPTEISASEMHQHSVGKLAAWVEQVVAVESPVHIDEVAKRMVEAAGITRIGPRIREHIKLAAKFAEGSGRIQQRGDFLWQATMQYPPLRNRSELPLGSRKLKYIAPEELSVVIYKVVRDSVAIHSEAAFPLIARMLGFSRVTEDMRTDLLQAIEEAVAAGKIEQEEGLLTVTK